MRLKLKQLLSIGLSTACIMASANLAFANPTPPPTQIASKNNGELKELPIILEGPKHNQKKYENPLVKTFSDDILPLLFGNTWEYGTTRYNPQTDYLNTVTITKIYNNETKLLTKVSHPKIWDPKIQNTYSIKDDSGFYYINLIKCFENMKVGEKVTFKFTDGQKRFKTRILTLTKDKNNQFKSNPIHTYEDPKPSTHTVRFEYDGKLNPAPEKQSIEDGKKATNPKLNDVEYWHVKGENEDTPYNFDTPIKKDLTLVAKRKEYQVNFYKWNGDKIIDSIKVKAGDTVKKPDIANVKNWYTTQKFEDGTEYNFDTLVTGNLELFAKEIYKVTLKYKNENKVVEIKATANGARLEKKHYGKYENVEYWYPENEPNKKYLPQNLQFVNIYDDTTFIAKIKEAPTEHTVTFQYGSVLKTISVKHNEKVSAPDISGWKDSDGDRLEIKGWKNGNNNFDFNTPITQNLTLTAEQQDKFTVTFQVEGIDNIPAQRVYKNKTASAPKLNIEIEKWHLNGTNEEFKFDTPITGDITIIGDKKEAAPPNDNGGQQPQDPGNGGQQPQDPGSDNNPNPFIPPLPLDFDSLNIPETTIDDNVTPLSTSDEHSTEPIEDEDVILSDDETDSEDETPTDEGGILDEDLPLAETDIKKEDELEIDGENVPLSNIPKTSERSIGTFYLSLTLMGGFFFSLFELLRKKINK